MQWLSTKNTNHKKILTGTLRIFNSNQAVVKIIATMGMAADINNQITHHFLHFCQTNPTEAAKLPPSAKLFYTTGEPNRGAEFYEVPFELFHE